MKKFFATFKVLMMSLIVALIVFTATPFNESTAEASEVYAYSEGSVDYYVDTNIEAWDIPGIAYVVNMIAHGTSYPPILTIRYGFMDTNSEEDRWMDKQGWGYEVVFQYTGPIGGNPFFSQKGHLSESWKAQKVFNIVYPKILEKRRELREEEQNRAERKRLEEQRIAEEKRRKEEEFNSPVAQGDKFYAAKNYPAAAKSYAEARKINSIRYGDLYINLVKNGDNLDKQGQHLAALDYYKKAVTMNASGVNCSYELKRTYLKVKNFDDAILFYKAMTTGGYWDFWDDLAEIYYELKDYENAVKAYTSAISHYASTDYYNGRGKAYSALGQYERAIQDFDKAITYPEVKYYVNRGKAYSALGQYKRAIQDYNKAIKLNKHYDFYSKDHAADAYYNRGLAYEQLKEYKKALKDYQKTLELESNYEKAKQGIKRVSKMK